MAKLKFEIQADWEKVQKLRDEINKLKQEIKNTDAIQNPTSFNNLNDKLQTTSKELNSVTGRIARASAVIEGDFKKKIFDASQSVNHFAEEIIKQKKIIADTKEEIRTLTEQYRSMGKYERSVSPISTKLKEAKDALAEQKYALFDLTQEQATARLSVKRLRDEYALLREEGGGTADTMDLLTSKLKSISGMVIGGMGLKELASHIISVRGEFESMETSLKVLLGGSQQRLDNLMGQIKEYALASPLNTKDMVGAVQMMTSFGIEAEKSIDYLKAIGDISMGDTGKFNSLALAFSQMSSAGKLMGQDLMQMVNAGFNPLEEISRKTGKSIGELKNEMSKGAITSKMVQDAFISATSAGGKFFGMSSEGAKTLNGQISMLQESFDNMFNEIGKKGEGVVMKAVQAGTFLVENYETIGKILEGLILTYGVYRTGLILNIALEKAMAANMTITGYVIDAFKAKWAKLNATALLNPYVLAAAAIASFGMAIWEVSKKADATSAAQDRLDEANRDVARSAEIEINKLNGLRAELEQTKKGTKQWKAAKDAIVEQYGQYDSRLAAEIERTGTLTSSYDKLTAAIRKSVAARQLKQFYDKNTAAAQDDIQKRRGELWGALARAYGQQTANLLMRFVNQYAATGSGLDQRIIFNGKKTTVRSMIRPIHSSFFSTSGISDANYMRQTQVSADEALDQFAAMNGISKEEKNEIAYGIKPTKKEKENNIKWTKAVKDARKKAAEAKAEYEKAKKGGSVSDVAKAKKKYDDAEQAYKSLSGSTTQQEIKTSQKEKKKAEVEAKRKQKQAEREAKKRATEANKAEEEASKKREYVFESNVTRKNKEEEDAIKAAEAKEEERITSITDAGEKERAAYQLQYDKTIRQVRKEADDLRKAKYDENKRDWDNKNTDKTKVYSDTEEGKKNYKEIKLTTDQESYLQSLISKADKEYTAQRKKWQQEEVDALNSYLKEYGSFEEKKLAITKEYEEKMQNAKSVGEKATLQMQRDKEIEKAKEDNINTSIDWNGIFSDLQGHTKDYLLGLRDQLQDLLSSGNLPIDQMQVVSEKINAIDEELGKQQGIWNFIGEKAREHNRRLKEAADAQERLNVARNQEATEALRLNEVKQEAQKQLSSTGIDMSLDEISTSSLNGKIDLTDEKFKSMSPILQKLAVAEAKLAEARNNTITATNKAKQAEDGAKRKSAQAVADWFDKAQEFIEKKGIDQLPDLLGSIGLGKAGDKVSKGLDALNSAAGAAGDFASGNYVGAALKGISAIKSFGSMLGIGGGNEKEVARTTERLTKSNEELGKRIDSLSERIGNSAGNKAIYTYETALKAQKEINANSMEILKKQMGYHSAHHSNNSYASDSKIASYNEDAQRAFAAAGVDSANITGLSSIYSLSPEQLKAIRDFAPNLWKYLTEVGKYDKKEYWDAVVEQAGKTEKLTEQIKNNLTQTSFDSLRSSFLDTLMDMNADAEDWSNNFAKMLFKSLVNRSVLNDDFDKWLKDFQNKWAKKLSDGDMSQSDYEAYKSEYSKKMEELKKKTDNLASYMGYSDENAAQKATANGVSSITFEQATNIIALTTAGNISRDQIKDILSSKLSSLDVSMKVIQLSSFDQKSIADETRTILANSYLELQGIHDDTTSMNKFIKVMSNDVSDIKRKIKDM
nr:MAG TPA: tail tape measure protein [Caudoviricetes sp.]